MSILEVENLTRTFGEGSGKVTALQGVSLSIGQGSFTAVMGRSGSGKSTLLNLLGGLDVPTSGRVLIEGQDLSSLDDATLTRLRRDRVGFIFQSFNLLPEIHALDNVLLPSILAGEKSHRDQALRLLSQLGLQGREHHRPSELSGGQQQRVAIARALFRDPAVIVADEPTGALDVTSGSELMALLRDSCRRLNQTIVMVTHDPAVAAWSDRLIVIRDGRVVTDVPTPAQREIVEMLTEEAR